MNLILKNIFVGLIFCTLTAGAQIRSTGADEYDASDPATMKSRFTTDIETYFFVEAARYYAVRLGYEYGLENQKHLVGMSLPMVHTIFNADFGGYENTTGIGDLKMRYMFVPFQENTQAGWQRVSAYFEVTAPTGDFLLGRGAGTWLHKPGIIFTYRANPDVAFYPEIKFQFSGADANTVGGGDGAPDPNDPAKEAPMQNLSVSIPAVVLVNSWDGWISLNALYVRSFTEKTGFLFLRTDFGKMIGNKTSASLNITKFIAGQPRLNVLVQAKLQFFVR